jgi:hypothetical protein
MKIDESTKVFGKSISFFVYGVALGSLFIWCIIQGIKVHLNNMETLAFSYYFLGWVSGVGGLALYWQAKRLFHFAEISK